MIQLIQMSGHNKNATNLDSSIFLKIEKTIKLSNAL